MTNIKKLGLTALAGSLAATSAYAGALDVSGTAKITYVSPDASEVAGNPFSMSQGIGFSGSGDLDNGMSIAYQYSMTDAAFSSSSLKLDMGDNGTLSYSDGAGTTGISAYDDKMPTASEEVWDDMDGEANGIATISNKGTLGYANDFGAFGVSLSFNKNDAAAPATTEGSSKSLVLTAAPADGVSVFIGTGDKAGTTSHNTVDLMTVGGTYTSGSVTVGAQMTEIDKAAANTDQTRMHAAISFAVNENLSLSYGHSVVDFDAASTVDQKNSGLGFSYTMGSMTVAGHAHNEEDTGGASGTDDTQTEVSVAFAF
jgi:outer membrane protein OmpU